MYLFMNKFLIWEFFEYKLYGNFSKDISILFNISDRVEDMFFGYVC